MWYLPILYKRELSTFGLQYERTEWLERTGPPLRSVLSRCRQGQLVVTGAILLTSGGLGENLGESLRNPRV